MTYSLQTPLSAVKGFGSKLVEQATIAGITTVGQFLIAIPSRYLDRSHQLTIDQLRYLEEKTQVTILGQITSLSGQRYGRRTNQKATLHDQTGRVTLRWFNSPFILNSLKKNHLYYFSGEYSPKYQSITQPTFEPVRANQLHTARLVPSYQSLLNIPDGTRRRLLYEILENLEIKSGELENLLEERFLDSLTMNKNQNQIETDLLAALTQIHFPDSEERVVAARYRLALEEILSLMQIATRQKREWANKKTHIKLPIMKIAQYRLPFNLTNDQKQALTDISHDLAQNHPMNRLLLGDVGSGKTIVAGIAAAHCLEHGYHACLIAPTKILVDQHLKSLSSHLPQINVQAVTVRHKLKSVNQTKPTLYIGTHALINQLEKINPALVIFDEQHRFGVNQRSQIGQIKDTPHVLTMSATPIPRSLMLTIFSHLNISQLKEMPPGRIPTKSWLTPEKKRSAAYDWLSNYLLDNPQSLAMVVCPFIDPSTTPGFENIKSASEMAKDLKKRLPKLKIELVHGRLKADQLEKIIEQAKTGAIDVLVTTTVVEVGMDLPNADVLIIEGAERFGLASLHQLRGRVGRRGQQGYCYLFTTPGAKSNHTRLKKFTQINNGQELAELDLKNRGAGDLFGVQQHGFDNLKFFNWTDLGLIELAQKIKTQLSSDWQSQLPLISEEKSQVVAN